MTLPTGAVGDWIKSVTTDQAEQQKLSDAITSIFGGVDHIPTFVDQSGTPQMAPWAQQFLQDEWDAQKAGDWYGNTLDGFRLPTNISTADWTAALGLGEKWAALTGYKWMPTGNMLLHLVYEGITDQQGASDYFYSKMPQWAQAQYANARAGMSHNDYQTALSTYQDNLQQLTGSRDAQFGMDPNQAVHEHWSTQRWEQTLRSAYSKNDAYAYLNSKYGTYNYNSWQQHMADTKQQIQSQYGNTDMASYIKALDNPQQAFGSTGGVIQQVQPGKGTAVDYGASAVR